jgi:hypothetical protein
MSIPPPFDTDCKDDPTCPYCGETTPDDPSESCVSPTGGKWQCGHCERYYYCTANYSVSYDSWPMAKCHVCGELATLTLGGALDLHTKNGYLTGDPCPGSGSPAEAKEA